MTTLHVTNGDSVAGALKEIGPSDEPVLPWRDVLHDGPVPGGLDGDALRQTRATFLAGRGASSAELILADLAGRDAQLAAMGSGDAVVLWFEPDLYDQLQLIQILARLYLRPKPERPPTFIVSADELLGPLSKFELGRYIELQREVREVDLEMAAAAWEAFTSSDVELLKEFAKTETELFAPNSYRNDPAVVLPHLHPAMRRLLQEFPSETNGLSRTEQQTLDVLVKGARTLAEAYQAAHAPKEEWIWLGDWSFAWYVDRLMSGRVPLIESADGSPLIAPGFSSTIATAGRDVWKQPIRLTEAGQSVATGTANAIALNGIDRWIGGVHLVEAARE